MTSRIPALALGLILAAGCAHPAPPLVVTGRTIEALGREFEAVGGAFYAVCTPPARLPVPACTAWADFADRFKPSYAAAVAAWNLTAGGLAPGDGGVDVAALEAELVAFGASLGRALYPDGGAP